MTRRGLLGSQMHLVVASQAVGRGRRVDRDRADRQQAEHGEHGDTSNGRSGSGADEVAITSLS